MRVVSVVSTKGGVGKTTVTANLGGLLADAGLRVLLLDLDSQPTLSSYYPLAHAAPAGTYELIALNLTDHPHIISSTRLDNLDLIVSNDEQGRLTTLLLHAPDGRVLLLGNVRCMGFYFSPVNFYFCYRQGEARYLLAEVSNTPWNERHYYLLDLAALAPHDKDFHVSPFMGLAMRYHWRIRYLCLSALYVKRH